MAYTANGAGACRARDPSWLGIVARIFTRGPKIWFSFPHDIDLGPCCRTIRRAAVHLWNAGFFADRLTHCRAIEHRNGGVSDRTCAALDSATARFSDRNAGGDSRSEEHTSELQSPYDLV